MTRQCALALPVFAVFMATSPVVAQSPSSAAAKNRESCVAGLGAEWIAEAAQLFAGIDFELREHVVVCEKID